MSVHFGGVLSGPLCVVKIALSLAVSPCVEGSVWVILSECPPLSGALEVTLALCLSGHRSPAPLLPSSRLSLPSSSVSASPFLGALSGSRQRHHLPGVLCDQAACVTPRPDWDPLPRGPRASSAVWGSRSPSPAPSLSPSELFSSFLLLPSCVRPASVCACQSSSLWPLPWPFCCGVCWRNFQALKGVGQGACHAPSFPSIPRPVLSPRGCLPPGYRGRT